jgi:hypothetical protein
MWYDPNGEGPNNHTFYWILSEEEVEYLTHDKNEPVTVTRWFRFIAKDYTRERKSNQYTAPYPYIYIRCQMTLTRPDKNWAKWGDKIKNYWYYWNPQADLNEGYFKKGDLAFTYLKEEYGNPGRLDAPTGVEDGVANGFSAIVFDIEAPRSGRTIKNEMWDSPIHNTIVKNTPLLKKGEDKAPQFRRAKYYFTPKTNYEITALNGKRYRVTVENKNYNQPFFILDATKQGIIDNKCYVTLNRTAYQYGTEDPFVKDFQNSGNGWKTYDQMFCRYVWPHAYWNVENKGEYWLPGVDRFTYQPMDSYTEEAAASVINIPFAPIRNNLNIANIKTIANRSTGTIAKKNDNSLLMDGTAIYNNNVAPEVYNASGYKVAKAYYVGKDSHDWDESKLKETLRWCSIIYDNEEMKDPTGALDSEYRGTNNLWRNAGVFNDSILYAEDLDTHVYTPIAMLTKQNFIQGQEDDDAGNIQLIHYLPIGATAADVAAGRAVENYACYDVLNALGYPRKFEGDNQVCDFEYAHRFINQQMRAWVGVVAVNDCNIAQYVQQDEYDDDNIATFLTSWERPINLKEYDPDYALDAKTEENYVYFIDYLKFYDWRGDKYKDGYMYDDHYWFWAYYNIKEIDVDLRYDRVLTTMHHPELDPKKPWTWNRLSEVTRRARLLSIRVDNPGTATARVVPGQGDQITPYEFDLVDCTPDRAYTYAVNNDALKAYMGISPIRNTNKARFGGFYYENNGDNVTDFYVWIPVTIHYEWGKFQTHVRWLIKTTHGRDF